MAELLYRIGRFAARRHWAVIGAWLAVLAVTVVTYLSFAGALSSSISLPDTPTTRVSQQLEEDFEGTGGGNGAIVAETSDGSAFTSEQQRELVDSVRPGGGGRVRRRRVRPLRHAGPAGLVRGAGGRRPPAAERRPDPAQRRPGADRRRSSGSGRSSAHRRARTAPWPPSVRSSRLPSSSSTTARPSWTGSRRRSTSRRLSSSRARPCPSCRPASAPCRRTAAPRSPT